MAMPAKLLDPLPLESGDRLSREEFHRRYKAYPEIRKAELVDGVVYLASPVRWDHGGPHGTIAAWLGYYASLHRDIELHIETSLLLQGENEVQPDALLRRREGGMSSLTPGGFIQGPPEFIVEVAASSASYDVHNKLQVYERNGVQEYLVWQVYDRKLRWFRLVDGRYEEMAAGSGGTVQSEVLPGLRLSPETLLEGDLAGLIAGLQ